MSLNKYMHPRNRYKNSKPSFLELALKYPEFRAQVTQNDTGKVLLDFKNADALRALSTCLLKEDFDITVELPPDRLVPTLPLRLNYIHWIEDILGTESGKWGIDIGTGASCIYPLLAAKMNSWNFLATESDTENVYHAKKNIETNKFGNLIHVMPVTNEEALSGPLEKFTVTPKFDFCMCNPPFFADHMEAQAIDTSRSDDRPEPSTISTASPQECIAQGGEVGFVRQMIEESTVLRDKIRVYTSMVGKKASLTQLKEELRHQKVPKYSTTEFCQGKTMRWGIAWTYDASINFPRSQFDSRKEKPPLQFFVPKGAGKVEYTVHTIAEFLKNLLRSMKIHCYQGKTAKSYSSITLTAVENTWSHQRRLRRQQQRQKNNEGDINNTLQGFPDEKECQGKYQGAANASNTSTSLETPDMSLDDSTSSEMDDSKVDQARTDDPDKRTDFNSSRKRANFDDGEKPLSKKQKLDNGDDCVKSKDKTLPISPAKHSAKEAESELDSSSDVITSLANSISGTNITQEEESPKEFILKCVMRLKRADERISLELEWLDGQSRELMHQVKTFIQNKLKVEPTSSK